MTFEQLAAAILGQGGVLVLLLVIVWVLTRIVTFLWNDHVRADTDDRAQRDEALGAGHDALKALAGYGDVLVELKALRKEVAALRAALRRKP